MGQLVMGLSGILWLDWAILAISLFNTFTLFWLGLTVLLNSENRTWGIWLAGGGLSLAGAFFLCHTALIGQGLDFFTSSANFWWQAAWIPITISPLCWYVAMLWYAGSWERPRLEIYRRHFPWLVLVLVAGIVTVGLILFANPLPSFSQVASLELTETPEIAGIPILILSFPVYLVACIGLSIDALLRPGPASRLMASLARRRARPWFLTASIDLLFVSLLVGWAMFWINSNAQQHTFDRSIALSIAWFDLAIAALIGLAIVMIGQAVVSYEIFTGRALPRRGLLHYWRRALILAGGYSMVVSLSLSLSSKPVYTLLLSTLIIVSFYALLNWRNYAERERLISQLRPFVASQQLYNQLLKTGQNENLDLDIQTPFRALCEDILEAEAAYLIPQGPLAPLFGPPRTYPEGSSLPGLSFAEIAARFTSPQTLYEPIEGNPYGKASWAVPLWNEKGLIGLLLLGAKRDGGVYTQEEIEIARTTGERLMDIQASAEIARRLMVLQRQRLAESQVVDQRTRRALHDEILPQIHATMLALSNQPMTVPEDAIQSMAEIHRQISDLLHTMPKAAAPEVAHLGLFGALAQALDGELKNAFDRVESDIPPEIEQAARSLAPLNCEVLFYAAREAIRNAALHARGNRKDAPLCLHLKARWENQLEICIQDNGVGFQGSGENNPGSRQGLALHSTMMAVIGGSLAIESEPSEYTRVILALPQPRPDAKRKLD
jgi:signal transduction histidine kinase